MAFAPLEEDEEENSKTKFLMPKFHGQPSNAVSIFCGPNVGLVWPWKSHPTAGILEVRGYRLRGQYLPHSYKQLEEDLDNNPQIQQALNIQRVLLEGMLQEVQEFCREHHWITGIYEFLQSWGPQKLEDMRGCPIKNYVMLVSRLNVWQTHVSNMPVELLTKGKLLLLSCHDLASRIAIANSIYFLQRLDSTGPMASQAYFLYEESKLNSIREDILAQVQNECWSRSQQLMTELTDFMHVFQTINSDIHTIAQCTQKFLQLNDANEKYIELEERMEYIRALHEFIRNHFSLLSAENEALDISLLDMWDAFQFEKSQASEFLLNKRHSIMPKLQQLMAAALAELEGLLGKALSGPFMDPTQDQRSTEHQLISLERQFQNTVSNLSELHHAYAIFTGTEDPRTLHYHSVIDPSTEIRVETQSSVSCMTPTKPWESHTFTDGSFTGVTVPWINPTSIVELNNLELHFSHPNHHFLDDTFCHYEFMTDHSATPPTHTHNASSPGLNQPSLTGDETPVPLPICGTRPIVQQQRIWHLYRVISENISEWNPRAGQSTNYRTPNAGQAAYLSTAGVCRSNQPGETQSLWPSESLLLRAIFIHHIHQALPDLVL
ncbi:Dynein heavy chain domain-containing protein 1 [Saguinus oedipus]|uniref:Dynein heavy chain domain-containing protein 1 n=1 Tax=Saguinus oedipus TaxID=9490 RepID=A0ABQ9UWF4_SAGOE|nr:Dynein heavy chain domain-containing protein 1 [Saguinus oedipus]